MCLPPVLLLPNSSRYFPFDVSPIPFLLIPWYLPLPVLLTLVPPFFPSVHTHLPNRLPYSLLVDPLGSASSRVVNPCTSLLPICSHASSKSYTSVDPVSPSPFFFCPPEHFAKGMWQPRAQHLPSSTFDAAMLTGQMFRPHYLLSQMGCHRHPHNRHHRRLTHTVPYASTPPPPNTAFSTHTRLIHPSQPFFPASIVTAPPHPLCSPLSAPSQFHHILPVLQIHAIHKLHTPCLAHTLPLVILSPIPHRSNLLSHVILSPLPLPFCSPVITILFTPVLTVNTSPTATFFTTSHPSCFCRL